MPLKTLALLVLLGPPARAQDADHETFRVLGWNRKECSVAVAHYAFPRLGDAIADQPIMTRIGRLSLAPGGEEAQETWLEKAAGKNSWDAPAAEEALAALKKSRHVLPGYAETLRWEPVVDKRELPRLLLTTDTFRTGARDWPPAAYRLAAVHYSPLSSPCGLLLYRHAGLPKDFFQYRLIRIHNPVIRLDRALAHVTNGKLLLERGDAAGALAETAVAAAMAPEYGLARYHHGTMLALHGKTDPALDELATAVGLDPQYRGKARGDRDWESLRWHPRFKELTRR